MGPLPGALYEQVKTEKTVDCQLYTSGFTPDLKQSRTHFKYSYIQKYTLK